MNRERD